MKKLALWWWLIGLFILIDCLVVFIILNTREKNKNPVRKLGASKSTTINPISSPLASVEIKPRISWTLLLTGDVIPARVVNQKMVAKNDFMWPLASISGILKDADLTVINLESPLLDVCPMTNEGFKFCGDSRFAQSLAKAGVDVASLANNHSLNYGWEAVAETERHLQDAGIEATGFMGKTSVFPSVAPLTQNEIIAQNCVKNSYCSRLVIKQVKSIKVGFLGYNAVGQLVNRKLCEQEIKIARKVVDVLVISVHWGKEYVRAPTAEGIIGDDPKELGHLFIDWGADLVHGNHPHVIQGVEYYKGKPIFYALGNTVFDQEWSPETKRGILIKLHLDNTDIVPDQTEIIPIGLKDYGQAYLLEDQEKAQIIHDFNTSRVWL